MHLQTMVKAHSAGFWNKVLPGRRATVVTKASNKLWIEIIAKQFFETAIGSKGTPAAISNHPTTKAIAKVFFSNPEFV